MAIARVFRWLLINLLLVIAFWLGLLFITAVAGDLYSFAKMRWPGTDERLSLPNYPDKDRARRMFADFKRTVEDYVPFVVWRRLPMTTEFVNIGANGLRIHHKGPENNLPGAVRIGFFGGSTMWGTGVEDDCTIPANFDQLTTGYAVTNYGEGGHNTRQMFALLVNLIDTRQMPEEVAFYDGFNHIWTHCNYAVTESLNGHMIEQKLRRALTERPSGGYLWADVVAPPLDFFRRIIGEKKFVRDRYACQDDPVRAEQVAEALVRLWEMAEVLVRRYGGRFHAFLQPVAYLGNPRLDHLELPRVVGAEQFRTVYPIIQRKMAERDAPWFTDLSDAVDGDQYLYIDDAHVTCEGNAIIARRMLKEIGEPAAQ